MSDVWLTIGVLAVATAAIRASGPLLVGGRSLPDRLQGVVALLAPALLAALVVVQTISASGGGAIELDARLAGVTAAAGVIAAGGSLLPVVTVAAVVTAVVRALL